MYLLLFQSGYLENSRFQRLFEVAQEFNLISIEGLIKVENLFGSTRYMPMIVGFLNNNTIPELLINNFCLINCDNFYSNKYLKIFIVILENLVLIIDLNSRKFK